MTEISTKVRDIIEKRRDLYLEKERRQDFAQESCINWWDAYRHTREAFDILISEIDAAIKEQPK
jgi:hypothetical protein